MCAPQGALDRASLLCADGHQGSGLGQSCEKYLADDAHLVDHTAGPCNRNLICQAKLIAHFGADQENEIHQIVPCLFEDVDRDGIS